MSADDYRNEHTLAEPTDPAEMDEPDAYQVTKEGEEVDIDPLKTVLVARMNSCLVESHNGKRGVAFQLQGTTGDESATVAITHLATVAGAGKIVGQLIELCSNTDEETAKRFHDAMADEIQRQVQNRRAHIEEHRDDAQ